MRCKNEKYRIWGVLVLNAPDHRWEIKAKVGAVQQEFFAVATIVSNDRNVSSYTDQKLMAFVVRVFTTRLDARNIEHHEVTLGLKWDDAPEFTHSQASTNVRDPSQGV